MNRANTNAQAFYTISLGWKRLASALCAVKGAYELNSFIQIYIGLIILIWLNPRGKKNSPCCECTLCLGFISAT